MTLRRRLATIATGAGLSLGPALGLTHAVLAGGGWDWSLLLWSTAASLLGAAAVYAAADHLLLARLARTTEAVQRSAADLSALLELRPKGADEVAALEDRLRQLATTIERVDRRQRRARRELHELATAAPMRQGRWSEAVQLLAETAVRVLEVERVTVWRLDQARGELRMVHGYDAKTGATSEETPLSASELLRYLNTLKRERAVRSDDVSGEAGAMYELQAYLKARKITATLDIPVRLAEQLWGVICCEHRGGARKWTLDEEAFANSLADLLNLCLEAHQREDARQAADSASKAKSEFLAAVSHEIRSPMNAMLGFAEIMARESTDKRSQAFLEAIQANGKNLLRLLDDLLDLSRLESGTLALKTGSVNVAAVANEVASQYGPQAENQGLRFVLDIDPELPGAILFDEARLRQILHCLVGNAVKYTAVGEVTLAIKTRRVNPRERSVDLVIQVRDTGPGLSSDDLDRIFHAFVLPERRTGGGTGLGLAIVHRLLKLIGGSLSLESRPGHGSAFTAVLPRCFLPETAPVARAEKAAGPQRATVLRRVLVVDDDASNRFLLRTLLGTLGASAIECGRPVEAVELAAKEQPDVVLLDLMMPDLDGRAVALALRAQHETAHLPVALVTATTSEELEAFVRQQGLLGLLLKPLDRERLAAFLRLSFTLAGEAPPTPAPASPARPAAAKKAPPPDWRRQLLAEIDDTRRRYRITAVRELGERLQAVGTEAGEDRAVALGHRLAAAAAAYDPESIDAALRDAAKWAAGGGEAPA